MKNISKLTQEFDQKRLDFILKMRKTNPDMGRIGGWRGEDDDVADCPNYGHQMGRWKGYRMGPGMMGRGYGMGPDMRGPGYGMGPGMRGDDDGDWNCPYDGRLMGPGRGYGMMGRGYGMGSGMMMGRGYGMGPGMMGDDDGDWNCPYDGRSMGSGRGFGMMGRGFGMGSGMMMGRGYGMGPGYGQGQGSMETAPEQGEIGPTSGRLETPLKEDGARTTVENYLQSTRNPNLKLGKITEQGNAFEAEIVTKDGSLVDKLLIEKSTGWMHPANQ